MTEDIRKAVIRRISEKFKLPVYGQNVPQGVKLPCFTVELQGMTQKRLLGNRAVRTACFVVQYYGSAEKTAASDVLDVAEGLYEALLMIGDSEKFAASGMKHEKTAEGMKFEVEYEYHIIFTEDEAEKMQRLAYNGKEAVGYEEESDIQQGTTE